MSTWVCITAKDESKTIGTLVYMLCRVKGLDVIVVDDGSQDGTGDLARQQGALVIRHPRSQGIGPSLMDAWRLALQRGATRIAQMDAGGSHKVEDLDALLEIPAAVVIGSRFMAGSQYTGRRWRALLSQLAGVMCNTTLEVEYYRRVADWTSGFRVFRRPVVEYLLTKTYQARMHGWQIEVLAHALRGRWAVIEVPITYVAGASTFSPAVVLEALGVWRAL